MIPEKAEFETPWLMSKFDREAFAPAVVVREIAASQYWPPVTVFVQGKVRYLSPEF
jgi:hypothetical protein